MRYQTKYVQETVILPMFYEKNEKPWVSDSEDETYEVEYRDWHYILAAMIAELKKRRYIRRWHAACKESREAGLHHAMMVSLRTVFAKYADKKKTSACVLFILARSSLSAMRCWRHAHKGEIR
jgi:hypothetical protein